MGTATVALANGRNNLVLTVVALYLILNSGFMLVRFPPGAGASGVPIGEIILVLFLLSVNDIRLMPHFARSILILPFLIWWTFGIGRALAAVPDHGMWALRDATHVIESLFLWVGYVFASKMSAIDRFFQWLRRILLLASLHGLTFPFRESLKGYSPTIEAAAGYTTTLFFQYSTVPHMMLMAAARQFIIVRGGLRGLVSPLAAGLLIAFAVAFFQARTIYLQVICLVVLIVWFDRTALNKVWLALGMALLAFILIGISGVQFTGRLGEAASLDFIAKHFAAIAGIENEGVVGAARGVEQRLDWWSIIWQRLLNNDLHFFFGLGYGIPLTEFAVDGKFAVREPHNSYISIFARMGLLGVLVFTWGHILLLRVWFKAFKFCRRANYIIGQHRLLILLIYFVFVWVFSLGEDAFEKPYNAIPYYFFWGIILHYFQHLKRAFPSKQDNKNVFEFAK